MEKILLLALLMVATACSSSKASPVAPTPSSVPQSAPTTTGATDGLAPVETVVRWLEFVQEGDTERAATIFEASAEAAALGYESPGALSAFYGRLGWLDALRDCTEERLAPGVVALDCTFVAASELHDVLDVETEELRFIFEGATPTELSVARSGTLVHHELQMYARDNDGEAFNDSCSNPGQSGRFWYDRTCAEYLATILGAARDAVGTDS